LVRRIEVPTKFLPKQADLPNHGIRPNDAFESLSITPDDEHIYLVNEKALIQDGGVSEPQQTSVTRIVHKQRTAVGYEYVAEYPYILSALPNPDDADEVAGVLSISDIIAIAENHLLVVEKSFLTKPSIRNTV
ncbi:MAG: esterase-like activity of phytase family protein, partial [Gammaproteobacteria bacterium]